jgi:hypothetical protein
VASSGSIEKVTAGEYRYGLAPGSAARGVGTCTGMKAGSTISPGIGAAVVSAKLGIASPDRVAAWTVGEDRNWTRTRMGSPFPRGVGCPAR